MIPGDDRRARDRTRAIVAALVAVAAACLLRAPIANVPFERDEGEYAYIAWRWLHGELPYRDTFDQKPPAVFAAYAAIEATAGAQPSAVHWSLQLWLCGAQLVLLALAWRWLGAAVAAAAALLFALATSSPGVLGNAANVEGFALLPLVGAVALARRAAERGAGGGAVLAGASGAAALLFKPVTLPIVAFALAVLLSGAQRPARAALAARFGLGALAAVLPVLLGFAAAGGLSALYDATVRFNSDYAAALPLRDYPVYFRVGIRESLATLAPLYVAAGLGGIAWAVGPREEGSAPRLWIWGWLAAALLAAAPGGYFREHYFLYAAPPLALLAGAGSADLLRSARLPRRAAEIGALVAALGMIGWALWAAPWYYGWGTTPEAKARRLYAGNPFGEARKLAALVTERSDVDQRLFVYGSEPELHVYARRRNVGRYLLAYHYLLGPPEAARARQQEVLDALHEQRPQLVVAALLPSSLLSSPDTPRDLERGLLALLAESYHPIARLVPSARGPARVETDDAALAAWRAAPSLAPTGTVWLFERENAACRVGAGTVCRVAPGARGEGEEPAKASRP